jgi:CRP-like cAMP-binding protein
MINKVRTKMNMAELKRIQVPTLASNKFDNLLTGTFSDVEWDDLLPHLSVVDLKVGEVLFKSGENQNYVYFHIDSIVSLMCELENGEGSEFAIIGNEGLVGLFIFTSNFTTSSCAIVQCKGKAFKLSASIAKIKFDQSSDFRKLILRYSQVLMSHAAQTSVCYRHHTIEQQLCRTLLLCLDRVKDQDITLTQELISRMLGVRREGVTHAAIKLQALNIINYSRGHIHVNSREGLLEKTCECYDVVKKEYEKLFKN